LTSDISTDPARSHDASGDGPAPAGSRLRWSIAGILVALLVLALVLIVLEVTSLRPRSQQAEDRSDAESAAIEAAQRFTVQLNTYEAGSIPAYEKSVNAMLSPKFRASYGKAMDQLSDTIVKGKITSKGEVLASAVGTLDSDSAQVLVVADASAQTIYDKNVARHFRWQVSLVKIDGRWLVDNYEPVGA
jgi:Mce-associated membrane protein